MKFKKLLILMLFALLAIPVTWAQESTESTIYKKVTSADELIAGKKYIFVYDYTSGKKHYIGVAGPFKTNQFGNKTVIMDFVNDGIDIAENFPDACVMTLGETEGAWTFEVEDSKYLACNARTGWLTLLSDITDTRSNWDIVKNTDNGYFMIDNVRFDTKRLKRSGSTIRCYDKAENTYNDVYLLRQTEPELNVSTSKLDMGYNPTGTFTVSGSSLSGNITVSVKADSDEGFSVSPTTITPANGSIDDVEVTVTYEGQAPKAYATIVVSGSSITREVEVVASLQENLFTTKGNYYISNKSTGKYVVLENSQLATVTAENKPQADIISLNFNEDGEVREMQQYGGEGNMIATLNGIKGDFEEALLEGGYSTDFLDQMFTMKMVMTPDNDGSVYIVVDVPKIKDFETIRDYLISMSGSNPAINFYLGNMSSGKRHYLCVEGDDSFGFTIDNGLASKWMLEAAKLSPTGDVLFDTPGFYYIKNSETGKYVKLENSQLATVTATKENADIIVLDFNEAGNVSQMLQYGGEGDMIATLNGIKGDFEEALVEGGYSPDFLDDLFTMKMVYTPDKDGSVYIVVDVPEALTQEIVDYLKEMSGGNPAVNFYLGNMTPGQRHYLCADGDDSFGFTLDNGNASKWMVESASIAPADDDLFTEAGHYYIVNELSGKYVRLANSTLADVTATNEDEADIITLDFNEDGTVSVMKQYHGYGDMIATLNFIKHSFKEALMEGGYPTYFLDEMFNMRVVNTGDGEGSVFLCVDVPYINDFNKIRDYLIANSGGNTAINFYLSNMVPAQRHYLCVDGDDSFGFTLDNGPASKWMVHHPQVIPIDEEHFPDQYFRQFVHDKYDNNDNWWLSRAELDKIKWLTILTSSNPECANITSLQGIEYFDKMSCISVKGLDKVTSIDLSQNKEKLDSVWLGLGITSLDVSALEHLSDLRLEDSKSLLKATIDLTNNTNIKSLILNKSAENIIKGLNGKTALRYLMAEGNYFDGDTLNLKDCKELHNLQVVGSHLNKLILTGCEALGNKSKGNTNSQAYFYSNYLRALDLTGVDLKYNFNPSDGQYLTDDEYISHNIYYNSQITPKITPNVAYVFHEYYNTGEGTNSYTYMVYVSLASGGEVSEQDTDQDGEAVLSLNDLFRNWRAEGMADELPQSEYNGQTDEELVEQLAEKVADSGFDYKRVKLWKRFNETHDQSITTVARHGKGDELMFVHGTMGAPDATTNSLRPKGGHHSPSEWEVDPSGVKGDILVLGVYTVPVGVKNAKASGKVSYLYNTRANGTRGDGDVVEPVVENGEKALNTTQERDFYKSKTLTNYNVEDKTYDGVNPDYDNTLPIEFEWEITLSDEPDNIITDIDKLNIDASKEVAKISYVNLLGVESDRPFEGVNIVVTRYTDGSVTTTKVIK